MSKKINKASQEKFPISMNQRWQLINNKMIIAAIGKYQ
jgi:hypothetical protein